MQATAIRYEVPGWGVGELWAADGLLVWHELPRRQGPPRASSRFQPNEEVVLDGKPVRVGTVTIADLVRRLQGFFRGERVSFEGIELELDWCTRFQCAVAGVLRDVRYGETVTYGELAALAGYPGAQRAAGSFCARNRFPLLLPCHRVLAAGGLGSYGSLGVTYKQRLLELEGAL